jgi:hypothetical protein
VAKSNSTSRRIGGHACGSGLAVLAALVAGSIGCSSSDQTPSAGEAPAESSTARQSTLVEPKVLTTLELSPTHTLNFLELAPGFVAATEKYKISENKPVLDRDYESLEQLYSDLAGRRPEGAVREVLRAADERVAQRDALVAQSRRLEGRSAAAETVVTNEAVDPASVVGAEPSPDGLVSKDACSYDQANHDWNVQWFRDTHCGVDSDFCYSKSETRYRWIDHIVVTTSNRVYVTAMNAQKCNAVNWDLWFSTSCSGWSPCSHGYVFGPTALDPGWAQGGNAKGEGVKWEPNVFGSGRDADKDVFLRFKW